VEGHTSATEWRWAEGSLEQFTTLDCRSGPSPSGGSRCSKCQDGPDCQAGDDHESHCCGQRWRFTRDGTDHQSGTAGREHHRGPRQSPRDCSEAAGTAQAGSARGDSRGGARRSVLAKIATAGGSRPSVGDGAAERPAWCGVSRNVEVRRQTDGDSWNGLFDTQTGPKAGGSSLSISRAFFISQIISAGCVNKHTVEKQARHALGLDQHALSA
jgi:hypothetical protein